MNSANIVLHNIVMHPWYIFWKAQVVLTWPGWYNMTTYVAGGHCIGNSEGQALGCVIFYATTYFLSLCHIFHLHFVHCCIYKGSLILGSMVVIFWYVSQSLQLALDEYSARSLQEVSRDYCLYTASRCNLWYQFESRRDICAWWPFTNLLHQCRVESGTVLTLTATWILSCFWYTYSSKHFAVPYLQVCIYIYIYMLFYYNIDCQYFSCLNAKIPSVHYSH